MIQHSTTANSSHNNANNANNASTISCIFFSFQQRYLLARLHDEEGAKTAFFKKNKKQKTLCSAT